MKGRFEDPSELQRKLLLLDFVREATVINKTSSRVVPTALVLAVPLFGKIVLQGCQTNCILIAHHNIGRTDRLTSEVQMARIPACAMVLATCASSSGTVIIPS